MNMIIIMGINTFSSLYSNNRDIKTNTMKIMYRNLYAELCFKGSLFIRD